MLEIPSDKSPKRQICDTDPKDPQNLWHSIPNPHPAYSSGYPSKIEIFDSLKTKCSQQTFPQNMPQCGCLKLSLKFFLLSRQRPRYNSFSFQFFPHSSGPKSNSLLSSGLEFSSPVVPLFRYHLRFSYWANPTGKGGVRMRIFYHSKVPTTKPLEE